MADNGRRGTIQGFGDFFEAPTSSDCRLCEGLFARRDEIQVPPGAPLERLVLRLRDAGFIGGPLLQARALPDPESERIREQDRTFNAPAQRAREDDARTFRGPRPCQVRNLRLAEGRERGPIEVGRVDRSDDLPMPNEHECPTHPWQPPEATATTRTRSPSAKDSSTGIGRSRRTRKATPSGTCPLTPGPCGPALYLLRTKNAISPQLFGLRRRSPPSSPMPVRPGGPLPLSGTDVLLLLRHRRPGCRAAAWQADHLHAV